MNALKINIKLTTVDDVSRQETKTDISKLKSKGAIYDLSGFEIIID